MKMMKKKKPAKKLTAKQKTLPAFLQKKIAKKKSGAKPTNPTLYARVKAEAKRKYKVWPSAYASGWLTKTYKARGGKYK